MKIVFMGTPQFAVPCLDALINSGHTVTAVFTQTDKPVGRKQLLTPPPVKLRALELGIKVYQPKTLKDGTAHDILKQTDFDVIVVAAYGKFLPKEILDMPKYGCVNVHGSVLPKLRGASPIQWSIVTGEKETGITTMLMNEGMDTGDILEVAKTPIEDSDNFESLHDRLSDIGSKLLCETLSKLERGEITPKKQNDGDATFAPMIDKSMGCLDFSKSARELFNLIRAFDPWPSAYTFLNGKRLKVISSHVSDASHSGDNGIITDVSNGISVSCGNGTVLCFDTVQPEGSKKMSGRELLCGHRLQEGMKFGE